jgi:DNA modification methylase
MTDLYLLGDTRAQLRTLADGSINTCVTSPPYYGLRDYGCAGQIGLEATPDEYVSELVGVFREVRRVLRDDGTLWLNLGDSYNNFRSQMGPGQAVHGRDKLNGKPAPDTRKRGVEMLKEKDLVGIPWMVAFALRADGWYLRSDIIWSKPNPMPESVRDRPTKAHEYLFLLSKAPNYYYDADAIREPAINVGPTEGLVRNQADGASSARRADGSRLTSGTGHRTTETGAIPSYGAPVGGRNRRSVWTVTTQPFAEAHFATMPPALAEPCILAGAPVGGVVLDPFGGAGTTALVARKNGRRFVHIELNPDYMDIARRRVDGEVWQPGLFGTNRPSGVET